MTLAFLSLPPANVPFVFNLVKQPPPPPSCLLEPVPTWDRGLRSTDNLPFSHRTHPLAILPSFDHKLAYISPSFDHKLAYISPSFDHKLALYSTKRRIYALVYISPSLGEFVDVGSHPCRVKYQALSLIHLYILTHTTPTPVDCWVR